MNRQFFVIVLFSATLVACGGGSGGTSSALAALAPMTINAANEQQVASVGAGAGAGAAVGGMVPRSLPRTWSSVPSDLAATIQQLIPDFSKQSGSRAISQIEADCAISGTRSTALNDVNNNGIFDAGDSTSVVANACDDGDGMTISGPMTLRLNACVADFANGSCEAMDTTFDIAMSSVGGSAQMQGDVSFVSQYDASFTIDRKFLVSSSLSISFGGERVSFSNFLSESSWDNNTGAFSDATDFTVDVNVTGFVGRLVVNNTVPMTGNRLSGPYPTAGSSTITGAGGTTVVLDANTGDLNTVQVTTNGGAPQLFTWFELEQQSPIPSFF
ncbi:MAG: hypothetical protein Q9O24_02440 [Gammaproteobacteria bacterium]|nr:hypothetical protein [Gammaproteobacteria bacterium]